MSEQDDAKRLADIQKHFTGCGEGLDAVFLLRLLSQERAEIAKLSEPGGLTVNCLRIGTCSEKRRLSDELSRERAQRERVTAIVDAAKVFVDRREPYGSLAPDIINLIAAVRAIYPSPSEDEPK